MGKHDLTDLRVRIQRASGPDKALDKTVARTLGASPRGYTSSVDDCLDLVHDRLPDWHWHIGRGATGVTVYATLTKGERRVTAEGVTVPLVLLAVLTEALAPE